jgi:hypothetical protein
MVTPSKDRGPLLRSRQRSTGAQQTRFHPACQSRPLSSAYFAIFGSHLVCCDCGQLPFDDRSKDIIIVQEGLHHRKTFPDDLHRTLSEAARVLKDNGAFVVVELWLTTFLAFVHTDVEAESPDV